jgi:hypothetical protein
MIHALNPGGPIPLAPLRVRFDAVTERLFDRVPRTRSGISCCATPTRRPIR